MLSIIISRAVILIIIFYSYSQARLKNVDRSSATYHSVTVNDITVVITEFKPKVKKEKKPKAEKKVKEEKASKSEDLAASGSNSVPVPADSPSSATEASAAANATTTITSLGAAARNGGTEEILNGTRSS